MPDTLRLLMPQWQGGNNPAYSLGGKLLAWLAPAGKSENTMVAEVPIEPDDGNPLPLEKGVMGRSVLLRQLQSASDRIALHEPKRIIVLGGDCLVSQAPFAYLNEKYEGKLGVLWLDAHPIALHEPKRIIVLGGDCLVSQQAPFAYLNEKYEGKLGVLWLDAHPDVSTPEMHRHEHAMVLGNLLGEGDAEFAAKVKVPLNPKLVMYGGLQQITAQEQEIVGRLGLRAASPQDLAETSQPVLDWIKENKIEHLAIHFDLDVLDPTLFRSLLFAQPGGPAVDAPHGEMTLAQIARLVGDVSQHTDVVGFSIAEYLAWDEINLYNALASMPIFNQ